MPGQNDISYIARLNFRDKRTPFGIKQPDRLSHLYVIGKTGTGKSTLLETLIRQDIEAGRGCLLIDPHGDLVDRIAKSIPAHRKDDCLYVNVPDLNQPFRYNPLRRVPAEQRSLIASGVLEVFKKLFKRDWGTRMEHVLRNTLLALLEQPQATLADVSRLLVDDRFRNLTIKNITNPQVRNFWEHEYEGYTGRARNDLIAPILNKVGALLTDIRLQRILTEPGTPLSFRKAMDESKVVLINLAKGSIGEDSAQLLGGLFMTTLSAAAFSRVDTPEAKRIPFFVYLDEFQNFATLAMINMASELRKYGIGLNLAHQYLHQLDQELRYAVLGNAGTIISFRVGGKDAPYLAKEFQTEFSELDLMKLPNYEIYLKLMINGTPSKPFSARTLKRFVI